MSREFLFAHADANRRLLRAIEEALVRMRKGTFGDCDHCGSEIPLARLKAIPWARTCIVCQEELERERQYVAA
jgi:DnaK suppressor protein